VSAPGAGRPQAPGGPPGGWAEGDEADLAALLGWPAGPTGRIVGHGRRGVTVRARHPDGPEVAVKIGAPLTGERARRRHAEDTGRLRRLAPSAHLAALLAAGIGPGGHPWQAAPWVAAGSLADRLARGPLTAEGVADVAAGAGAGLADLHHQGVLHANLRPGNLLAGPGGAVLLTGMAVTDDPPPADLAHLPPEVIEGGPWTAAADIWALGSCLHALVSGQPPWSREAAEGPDAVVLAMATGRPPGLRPAGTPAWLSALIDACLSVDAAGRPADGATVAAMAVRRVDDRVDTLLPPSAPPEGRPLGSSYLLDDELGTGSSGLVWRGHRRWDSQPVAVKILRPELADDADAVARFLRERTTLVGLDHPNLVPVLDLVAEGRTLAIVMELVEGRDLRRVLRDEPLDPADACRLLAQAAAGIAAVHHAGIVHRDLKPENILVQGAGAARTARVTDFGIARAAGGPTVTRTDQLVGTAEYLAPELIAGRPVTAAADVYSLGVVAYELLCGSRPFHGDHPAAILQAHLQQAPAPLAGLPTGAWDVLARALAKDPGDRPGAAELGAQLAAWAPRLRGAPVRQTHPTPPSAPAPTPPTFPGGGRPGVVSPDADTPGDLRRPPVPGPPPASPAPVAPTASASRPTEQWSSWRSTEPPPPPGADEPAPARRSWPLLAGVAAVVLLGAGGGVAYALTRSSPAPPVERTVDVTASVTTRGPGTVQVTWQAVADRPHFATYVLSQDGTVDPQPPPVDPTSLDINQQAPGYHCYRVVAAFDGPVPPGLPAPLPPSKECVNIP
jgi:serine/threonine protein kinase